MSDVFFGSTRSDEMPAVARFGAHEDNIPLMRLGVVVPCYNEEEVLPETIDRLTKILADLEATTKASPDSRIYLVDDGSRDRTWEIIRDAAAKNRWIRGIKLSRNRGHQNAILAGLVVAEGDAVITIDADLQDDVDTIRKMVELRASGVDIVYGVRDSRASDSRFKRITAELFYKLLQKLGVDLVFNHADFRLMSRRAINALFAYSEVNLFVRGIIPQLGFSTASVTYSRSERLAGESKYPFRKMLSLAWDGVTSFSVVPLRIVSAIGLAIFFFSLFMIGWTAIGKAFFHSVVPGWASSVIPTYFLGGLQLLSIGIIGEYVGKIYLETKRRPRYFIEITT